jgi:aspartyl-tRNA synthetase
LAQLVERFDANEGDLLLFVADKAETVNKALAPLRVRLGRELELFDPNDYKFVWVVDFPLTSVYLSDRRGYGQAGNRSRQYPFTGL